MEGKVASLPQDFDDVTYSVLAPHSYYCKNKNNSQQFLNVPYYLLSKSSSRLPLFYFFMYMLFCILTPKQTFFLSFLIMTKPIYKKDLSSEKLYLHRFIKCLTTHIEVYFCQQSECSDSADSSNKE